jgi:hypothetical protein
MHSRAGRFRVVRRRMPALRRRIIVSVPARDAPERGVPVVMTLVVITLVVMNLVVMNLMVMGAVGAPACRRTTAAREGPAGVKGRIALVAHRSTTGRGKGSEPGTARDVFRRGVRCRSGAGTILAADAVVMGMQRLFGNQFGRGGPGIDTLDPGCGFLREAVKGHGFAIPVCRE